MGEFSKLNRSGLVAKCIALKQQAQSARERTFTVRRQFDALEQCGTDAEKRVVAMGKALNSIDRVVSRYATETGVVGEVIHRLVTEAFDGVELNNGARMGGAVDG